MTERIAELKARWMSIEAELARTLVSCLAGWTPRAIEAFIDNQIHRTRAETVLAPRLSGSTADEPKMAHGHVLAGQKLTCSARAHLYVHRIQLDVDRARNLYNSMYLWL